MRYGKFYPAPESPGLLSGDEGVKPARFSAQDFVLRRIARSSFGRLRTSRRLLPAELRFLFFTFFLLWPVGAALSSPQQEQKLTGVAWQGMAPNPYVTKDAELIKESYQESWQQVSSRENEDMIERARKVLAQWGYDRTVKYDVSVSESEHFVSVIFLPLHTGKEASVEIRIKKETFEIVSILCGS